MPVKETKMGLDIAGWFKRITTAPAKYNSLSDDLSALQSAVKTNLIPATIRGLIVAGVDSGLQSFAGSAVRDLETGVRIINNTVQARLSGVTPVIADAIQKSISNNLASVDLKSVNAIATLSATISNDIHKLLGVE
jgi:hypothetical protein